MTRGSAVPGAARQRVFLVGYYGVPNLGDEAIRVAIERAADRLGVDIVAYAARARSDDPRAVPVGLRGLPAQVRAIRAADRVVLGGGGILKDEGLRLPAELLLTAIVARLAGRRLTLLGVGVGPFYRRVGRWLVMAVARLAHVRTVRDEDSAAALRALRVSRVIVGADPIFSTDSGPDGIREAVPDAPPVDLGGRRAVVSVRPWFHTGPHDAQAVRQDALRRALADGLAPLLAADWTLDLVALYRPRDREESARLATLWTVPPGAVRVPVAEDPALDWGGLGSIVASADLVVAMRYHAIAAAALAERPIVAIAYEPKVASLAADLGIRAIAVDAPDLGASLAEHARAAVAGTPPTRPDPAALADLRQRAWSALRSALLD